jgi:hypothetical protein
MTTRRVWILFEPQIYCDLFSRILQAAGLMEIISAEPEQGRLQEGGRFKTRSMSSFIHWITRGNQNWRSCRTPSRGQAAGIFSQGRLRAAAFAR